MDAITPMIENIFYRKAVAWDYLGLFVLIMVVLLLASGVTKSLIFLNKLY